MSDRPTWQVGWPLRDDRGQLWEFAGWGCATGWSLCPHEAHATTCYALDPKGQRRYNLTACVDARRLTATLATIGPHTVAMT